MPQTSTAWRSLPRSRSSNRHAVNFRALRGVTVFFCFVMGVPRVSGAKSHGVDRSQAKSLAAGALYLEVQLSSHAKPSAAKPGDTIEGALAQDVYSGGRKIFPAGSRVRLTVSSLERRRRERSIYWPWVIRVFVPAHENFPTFDVAHVSIPGGEEIPLRVSLLSMSQTRHVYPGESPPLATGTIVPARKQAEKPVRRRKTAGRAITLTLQAQRPADVETAKGSMADGPVVPPVKRAGVVTLPAGTKARVILLRRLSASKSSPGESFRALLVQPIRLDSRIVLPEGSLFQGKVERRTRPRWLSRPGSIRLEFTRLITPIGGGDHIVASLAGADMDRRAGARMDSEGELRGGRPGIAWMLFNSGVGAVIAKESDDSFQLIAEAIASAATDASTAGTARIVAGVHFRHLYGDAAWTRRGSSEIHRNGGRT